MLRQIPLFPVILILLQAAGTTIHAADADEPFEIGKLTTIVLNDGKDMAKNGADDWRVIGSKVFEGKYIQDDSKKDATTLEVLNSAYREQIGKLNTEMPRTNPTKKKVKDLIDAAWKRLKKVLEGRAMAKKVNEVHKKHEAGKEEKKKAQQQQQPQQTNDYMSQLERHLLIMDYANVADKERLKDVKESLLSNRRYTEKALMHRLRRMQSLLDVNNFSYMDKLKEEVGEAHGHMNGAYKDLLKYAVVNEILHTNVKNPRDREMALGMNRPRAGQAAAAQQQQQQQRGAVIKEMGDRFRERMKMITDLLLHYEKETVEVADQDDEQKKKDLQKAQDKLFKIYQESISALHVQTPTHGHGNNAYSPAMNTNNNNNANRPQFSQPQLVDRARNCGGFSQHCFVPLYQAGMAAWCQKTCAELGQQIVRQ